jgi:oligoendopeptidase F
MRANVLLVAPIVLAVCTRAWSPPVFLGLRGRSANKLSRASFASAFIFPGARSASASSEARMGGTKRKAAQAATCMSAAGIKEFIDGTNAGYEKVHRSFEEQFWGTKMALSDGTVLADGKGPAKYSVDELTRTKMEMEAFLADPAKLKQTREFLKDPELTPAQLKTLKIFERTFGCYIMESEVARDKREESMKLEGTLESARNTMKLGAELEGGFEEMSSVGLRNKMRTSPDEAVRKACYEGLRSIGPFVSSNGFVEVVKARNAMAKALGYVDYYDYKVTQAEGFNKARLFEILDSLEVGTRDIMTKAREQLAAKKGAGALEPWNTGYMMAGDLTKRMDPYFPFEKSVEMWGRSFGKLGISYKGATMDLDLLDRKSKYSNGFCHWPQPAWQKPDGSWQPATTHFTSLADPAAVGSGHTALTTLMHEAGHAAHFANIQQPSPLFAQERAPTSVAYAELQSMFLDSLVGDAAWRGRYARDRDGNALPWALHEEDIESTHPFKVFALRAMLSVPYFEKALYELPDDEVTADKIAALADEVEVKIQGGFSPRPLLSVPHLLSDEASCYYHGYVLAEMAVHQTREHFLATEGFIVDNPKVGPALEKAYWEPGNSAAFLDLVKDLTGKPLSGDPWIKELSETTESLKVSEKKEYDAAVAKPHPAQEDGAGHVDLKMRVRFVDGDAVIADTANAGGDFIKTCSVFEKYVAERFPRKVAA